MSAAKFTFTHETYLVTEDARGFKIIEGEIFEVVKGEGFVVTTKVVVRADITYVARQLSLAQEYNHAE